MRHKSAVFAQAFITLALLAMVVRGLVPQGYMLAAPQTGHLLSIQICSGHGQTNAHLDLKTGAIIEDGAHGKSDSGKTQKAYAPCVFAAVAHLAVPVTHSIAVGLREAIRPALFAALAVAPGLGLAAPPPWSTGPPPRD